MPSDTIPADTTEFCHPETCPMLRQPREDSLRAVAEFATLLVQLSEAAPRVAHALLLRLHGCTLRDSAAQAGLPKSTLLDALRRQASSHPEVVRLLSPPTPGGRCPPSPEVCPKGRRKGAKG